MTALNYLTYRFNPHGNTRARSASKTIKNTHLELGGKAPVIIYDDADVAKVIEDLKMFSFYNAGQDCTQPCRYYVADHL